MTPKIFGGDIAKATEGFQKSLAVDPSQDDTWVWLSKVFQKQGDKTKARDASQLPPYRVPIPFLFILLPTLLHSQKSQRFYFQSLLYTLAKTLAVGRSPRPHIPYAMKI